MKSKKAFMLGAAMAATCFVSALPSLNNNSHLAAQAAPPAVKQVLKNAAKIKVNKAPTASSSNCRRRPVEETAVCRWRKPTRWWKTTPRRPG